MSQTDMNKIEEMAYPASFNFMEFNQIRTFAGRKQYCDQRLKRLSSGTGRIVYLVDDEKVLKLAKNAKGVAQNQAECRSYAIECGIGADVYLYDENGAWVEMQLARKATAADFRNILGCSFEQLQAFIYDVHNCYSRYPSNSYIIYKHKAFVERAYEEEWFDGMYNYMANIGLESIGDLTRMNSYGVVSENGQDKIVLIDMGLNDEVWDQFYKR